MKNYQTMKKIRLKEWYSGVYEVPDNVAFYIEALYQERCSILTRVINAGHILSDDRAANAPEILGEIKRVKLKKIKRVKLKK